MAIIQTLLEYLPQHRVEGGGGGGGVRGVVSGEMVLWETWVLESFD